MRLIFENWRRYLKEELLVEISFKDAADVLDGNRTKKILKNYRYLNKDKWDFESQAWWKDKTPEEKESYKQRGYPVTDPNWDVEDDSGEGRSGLHAFFKTNVLRAAPSDLTDEQKGLVVMWYIGIARRDMRILKMFLPDSSGGSHDYEVFQALSTIRRELERFFHYSQFMSKTDLMLVDSFQELEQIVHKARGAIEAYQDEKQYLDAEEGTEVLRDDEEWYIAVMHNKGAACHYGKGTEWCTAAPGLDYFEEYYKPDDPLFYFEHRHPDQGQNEAEENPDRYQFHYGSQQFMDENDMGLPSNEVKALHNLLKQAGAAEKYPIIKEYDDILLFETLQKLISGHNDLPRIEEEGGAFMDSLDPEVARKFAVWASAPSGPSNPVPNPPGNYTYPTRKGLEWLAGKRFDDNEQVGLNMAERFRVGVGHGGGVVRTLIRLILNHSSEKVRFAALGALWTQMGSSWMKDNEAPDGETWMEKYTSPDFKKYYTKYEPLELDLEDAS